MKIKIGFSALLSMLMLVSCQEKKEQKPNPESEKESTEMANLTYAEISVKEGGEWVGSEYKGGSFKNVEEVTLPSDHTDHSYYIRYEGPGWENKQVAYRLYLDWRNAIDIFGKKTDTIVLPYVGQDGFASYHEEADWGQDILKAGKSLGIGGFGRFMQDSVAHFRNVEKTELKLSNSDDHSEVEITYSEWATGEDTIDLDASLSIFPEDRYMKVELDPSAPLEGLATGLVKFDHIDLIKNTSEDGAWGYIASYGNQTLVNDEDQLGMALFYKTEEVQEVKEGPHDHLLIFEASEEPVTYYLLAAWEQEPDGIKSKEEFLADIDSKLTLLQEKGNLEEK